MRPMVIVGFHGYHSYATRLFLANTFGRCAQSFGSRLQHNDVREKLDKRTLFIAKRCDLASPMGRKAMAIKNNMESSFITSCLHRRTHKSDQ